MNTPTDTLSLLRASRCIVSAERVDLTAIIPEIPSPTRVREAKRLIQDVELVRITYRARRDLTLTGYVAVPHEGVQTLPCLMHLRGGSYDFGMLDPRQLLWQVMAYAALGYVVLAPQYPGVEGGQGVDTFGGPDDLLSITKLRDVLKALPRADLSRIGVKGHSRGGLMAYLLLREVSWVRAAVIASAPTDQVRAGVERDGWLAHQKRMFGRGRTELERRSPIRWADELPHKTPLLIMHGSADWRVDAGHSIRMSEALYSARVPHRFVLFEGAEHGLSEVREEYHAMTQAWLARYLAHDRALPNLHPHGA